MKRKNLVYIGNHLRSSAKNPTYSMRLISRLEADGFSVVASSSHNNKLLRLLDMWMTVFRHRKSCDYLLIDTYSTLNFYYAIIIGWWARRFKIAYIPVLHGGNLPDRIKSSPKKLKKYCQGAHLVVSPSAYLADQFEQAGLGSVEVIANAIDLERYRPAADKAFAPTLVWLRAFLPLYNPQLALQAFQRIQLKFPTATLTMAGPGDPQILEECQILAAQHKLNVSFLGKIDQTQWIALGQKAAVFLNTSTADNQPLSVIEAQAMGLPVVSTKVGGMPFLISEGVNGYLVSKNDPEAMAAAVMRILNSESTYKSMSEKALARAQEHAWPLILEKWKSILN
ncbi:glycosyltransferase family 4 protein [Gilvibacter sediminis]|uniref:glycosyltransferase family 4 protein n=1 Tax=Gilvibacter sediminis TaxID=379071 RepID=UPI0023500C0E|nr:glycosyltransferase family 4 protein [Gilvibacter sediminis]MDC7999245.1 glycosyltransferase family 4 protein [Gilvibacter sediminis]